MKRLLLLITAVAATGGVLASCYTPDPYVRRGRATGTVVGGVTGAVIGNNTGLGSWGGAAIGAGLGALAGDTRGKTNSMYYRSRPYYYY